MNAQLQTITQLQTEPIQPQPNIPRWNLALRIAFRFWLLYLGLYCLATQIITSLFRVTPADGLGWPIPDLATLCRLSGRCLPGDRCLDRGVPFLRLRDECVQIPLVVEGREEVHVDNAAVLSHCAEHVVGHVPGMIAEGPGG